MTLELPAEKNGSRQADGWQQTVYLQAKNQKYGDASQIFQVVITWRDQTPPTLSWLEPQPGAALELLGGSTQAQTTVLATVSDGESAYPARARLRVRAERTT